MGAEAYDWTGVLATTEKLGSVLASGAPAQLVTKISKFGSSFATSKDMPNRLFRIHSLKPNISAPKNWGFQCRNLQTSRGALFSGAKMLVSGRVLHQTTSSGAVDFHFPLDHWSHLSGWSSASFLAASSFKRFSSCSCGQKRGRKDPKKRHQKTLNTIWLYLSTSPSLVDIRPIVLPSIFHKSQWCYGYYGTCLSKTLHHSDRNLAVSASSAFS